MNKITHKGQDYEVLPLDRIGEITHAKLAGGVRAATGDEAGIVWIDLRFDTKDARFFYEELADFGIQPLKLLPKVPVEFVGVVTSWSVGGGISEITITATEESLIHTGMKFRCVEVTE